MLNFTGDCSDHQCVLRSSINWLNFQVTLEIISFLFSVFVFPSLPFSSRCCCCCGHLAFPPLAFPIFHFGYASSSFRKKKQLGPICILMMINKEIEREREKSTQTACTAVSKNYSRFPSAFGCGKCGTGAIHTYTIKRLYSPGFGRLRIFLRCCVCFANTTEKEKSLSIANGYNFFLLFSFY